jgi:ribosomal protein S6
MRYELLYLIAASREADLDTIKKEVEGIITTEGGVFEEKEVVEKRKLAYLINHETHGLYIARRFESADTQKNQEITRNLNLCTSILRSIISISSELPELKTKEERIASASAKQERKPKAEKTPATTTKTAPVVKAVKEVAKEEVKKEVAVEEQKVTEDIDKKLEEILNI